MSNEKEQLAAAQALRRVQEEVASATFTERQALLARVFFAKFVELKKAGFTADEALRLVALSPF